MYHVQVSAPGFSTKVSHRFNLLHDDVQRDFVDRWEAGQSIVCGGKVFDPPATEITVYEADVVTTEQLQETLPWMYVLTTGIDVTDRFITVAPGSKSVEQEERTAAVDPRLVAVVHGRDQAATGWAFDYLRALDLRPLEWSSLVKATQSAAPSNRRVVEQLFENAAAVFVLLTPDDVVALHVDLAPVPDGTGEASPRCQPRGNVLLEAGMAIAHQPDRTLFVSIGSVDLPSDLAGINVVRLDGSAGPLHALAERLLTAGCAVNRDGTDWLRTADLADLSARTRLPAAPPVT